MTLTRREFLGRLLHPKRDGQQGHDSITQAPRDFGSLAGDLPPELLAEEARRLGLDPATTDPGQIIAAISLALRARGPAHEADP